MSVGRAHYFITHTLVTSATMVLTHYCGQTLMIHLFPQPQMGWGDILSLPGTSDPWTTRPEGRMVIGVPVQRDNLRGGGHPVLRSSMFDSPQFASPLSKDHGKLWYVCA